MASQFPKEDVIVLASVHSLAACVAAHGTTNAPDEALKLGTSLANKLEATGLVRSVEDLKKEMTEKILGGMVERLRQRATEQEGTPDDAQASSQGELPFHEMEPAFRSDPPTKLDASGVALDTEPAPPPSAPSVEVTQSTDSTSQERPQG